MEFSASLALLLHLAVFLCGTSKMTTVAYVIPGDGVVDAEDHTTMSIDEILSKANNMSLSQSSDYQYSPTDHVVLTELDIAISPSELQDSITGQSNVKRTVGMKNERNRWPNKLVYYEILRPDFSTHQLNTIKNAMMDWSHYTCVKFQEDKKANARVQFVKSNGCYSFVGRTGGVQRLSLGGGCPNTEVILHEVGHALGFQHEQTRPDRDEYVKIHYENIDDKQEHNFRKLTWNQVANLGVPYDYHSIMHYSKKAFNINGRDTIETIDKKYTDTIGNQRVLSYGDVRAMNMLYKCAGVDEAKCELKPEVCTDQGGFVGKDCRCWCHGRPVVYCSEKDRNEKGSLIRQGCKDKYSFCPSWASKGYCESKHAYMLSNCKHSCDFC